MRAVCFLELVFAQILRLVSTTCIGGNAPFLFRLIKKGCAAKSGGEPAGPETEISERWTPLFAQSRHALQRPMWSYYSKHCWMGSVAQCNFGCLQSTNRAVPWSVNGSVRRDMLPARCHAFPDRHNPDMCIDPPIKWCLMSWEVSPHCLRCKSAKASFIHTFWLCPDLNKYRRKAFHTLLQVFQVKLERNPMMGVCRVQHRMSHPSIVKCCTLAF